MSIPERQVLLEHVDFLRAIALGVLRNEADADDAVQQTLATALQKPPADDSNLRGWLATVVRNFARMQLRSRSRRRAREEAVAKREGTPSAAQIAQRMEMERHVVDAIASLEEPFKTTLVLRFYDDLQPKDIAVRMGVPAATVRTRLKRGLDKLRAQLDEKSGGSRKATYAGLLLLAQLPARAAPLRWVPVAGVAAVLIGVVSIVSLLLINSEGAREPTDRTSIADRTAESDPGVTTGPPPEQPIDERACVVTGMVMDLSERLLPGVEVVAYEHEGGALLDTPTNRWRRWIEPPVALARTTTGPTGNYAITIDPPRPFWLVFSRKGSATRVLPVSDGTGNYAGVDMMLLTTTGIRGVLTDEIGSPIADANIHVWTPEYTLFGAPALIRVTSDKTGNFTLPVARSYLDGQLAMVNRVSLVVDARAAGFAPRVFRDLPAIFSRLKLTRGGSFTATTVPDTEVVAFGALGLGKVRADEDGLARFKEFPDGDRALVLIHPDYVPKQVQLNGSETKVSIALAPGVLLNGELRRADDSQPLASAAVGIAPQEVGDGMLFDALHAIRTSADGRFDVRSASFDSDTLVVEHAAIAPRQLARWQPLEDLRLPIAHDFRGRVVNVTDGPVAGARVRVRRRGFHASWLRDQRRMWTVITRADGSFVIRGMPHTRALMDHTRVEVWHPIEGAREYAGMPSEGPARMRLLPAHRIEIGDEPRLLESQLESHVVERAKVLGAVVGITDSPLEGVVVRNVAQPDKPVTTDQRGQFAISLRGPFPHTLRFEDGTMSRDMRVDIASDRLRVRLPEVVSLGGRVLHAGQPVEGAQIRVVYDGAAAERTQTEENGRYSLERWPLTGPRELVIEKRGFLTVRLQLPTDGDVELVRAAALVLQVEDEQGLPRNNVELRWGVRRLVSDRNGLVRLYRKSEPMPEFVVVPGGPGWIRVGDPVQSQDGEKLTIVVRRGERIEGRVVDAKNRGVPHVLVIAQPMVKGRAVRRAFTNSRGHFVLRALHPERYELRTGDAKHGVEIEAGTTGLVLREESR